MIWIPLYSAAVHSNDSFDEQKIIYYLYFGFVLTDVRLEFAIKFVFNWTWIKPRKSNRWNFNLSNISEWLLYSTEPSNAQLIQCFTSFIRGMRRHDKETFSNKWPPILSIPHCCGATLHKMKMINVFPSARRSHNNDESIKSMQFKILECWYFPIVNYCLYFAGLNIDLIYNCEIIEREWKQWEINQCAQKKW